MTCLDANHAMNSFSLPLNTTDVVAQCRGCLDRAGSARYRPTGRP